MSTLIKNCPICKSEQSYPIRQGYAVESDDPDYGMGSIYAQPEALSSGASQSDRDRLSGLSLILSDHFHEEDPEILDIGCGQGGLLAAMREFGYTKLNGMDPSPICVEKAREKGFAVFQGSLPDTRVGKFGLIILNHVLEHLWDIKACLRAVKSMLWPNGQVYVEVPNAAAAV